MNRFFDFVEIRTKITSLFAFAISLALLYYHGIPIKSRETAVFFASMFIFDLTTTAINNYIDTKTNGQQLAYQRSLARNIIFAMLVLASGLGLYLAYLTDLVVLLTGVLCFFCGIVYTYGPVAISRIPLGELLSGIFYGFFIPFLMAHINLPSGSIISYGMEGSKLQLGINLAYLGAIVFLAVAPTLTTANIMLANNTCDLEKDLQVNRFTLVSYIGIPRALKLYKWLYLLSFAGILLTVAFKIAPGVSLLAVAFGLPPALKNIRTFEAKQKKEETFVTSIKNYVLINGLFLLTILLGILLKR